MFVLQVALSAVQEMALLRIELKLALEQSARFTWHVLRLPVEFFNQRFAGDLANRVEANDRVARCWRATAATRRRAASPRSFLGIVMLLYDVTLAAIAIGGAALNVVAAAPGAARAAGRRRCACRPRWASCSPSRSSACSRSRR